MSTGRNQGIEERPQGWELCTLREILFGIEAGKSFTCEPRRAGEKEWGVIKVSAMTWGAFDESENKAVPKGKEIDPSKEIRVGDILLSRSNTANLVGATVLVGHSRPYLLLSDKSMRLLYSEKLSSRWLQRVLSSPQVRSQISAKATGTSDSMRNISQEDVYKIKIKLAPREEQERLSDLLDELVPDLEAGEQALLRAKAKLKLYRASLLRSAVTGDLTADWRAAHPKVEPASALLDRILKERRRLWEEKQLAKFEISGKTPPQNWKSKYLEPASPDTAKLSALPVGWCWATVDQCSSQIDYGSSAKTSLDKTGIPILRMGNVSRNGLLDFTDLKFLPETHSEFPSLLLHDGDILFNRTNSADLVGKTAVYQAELGRCSFASYLIRVRTISVSSKLISLALNSSIGTKWIKEVVNQTVGQANVNGTKLARFTFPLPPQEEQLACIERAEEQLSTIEHLESDLSGKKKGLAALRQALLRDAFAGNLSSQSSQDEPAHALLDRIAAERAERDAARGRKPKKQSITRKKRT